MWFICCDSTRIFFDEQGSPQYLAEVKKHECTTAAADAYAPEALTLREAGALTQATAQVSVFQHNGQPRGTLMFISSMLSDPILKTRDTSKVVIAYFAPDEGFPNGAVAFDIFLPEQRFRALSPYIERLLYSPAPSQLLLTIDFWGFRETPSDWSEYQVPTREQFFSPRSSKEYKLLTTSPFITQLPAYTC